MDRIKFTAVMLTALMLALSSCVRDVIMDAGERPQVVVECVLTNDETQELRLIFTKGASKAEAEPLTEAVATLIDLTEGKTVGEFVRSTGDLWTLDYSAVPDHGYRIEIQVPGYDLIHAEDTMPDLDICAEWYSSTFSSSNLYEYHSYDYVVYVLESLPDHTYISAMNWNPSTHRHEVVEKICTDYPYVDNFNLIGEVYSPQIDTVYRYGHIYYESLYPDLIGNSLHRRYLRIPRQSELKKKWLIVSGDMTGDYHFDLEYTPLMLKDNGKVFESDIRKGYVTFMGVSESYDNYLQDALYFQYLQESSDMTSIYIQDNIYTNIHGGLGIFGAMKEEKMQWSNVKSADFSYHYE